MSKGWSRSMAFRAAKFDWLSQEAIDFPEGPISSYHVCGIVHITPYLRWWLGQCVNNKNGQGRGSNECGCAHACHVLHETASNSAGYVCIVAPFESAIVATKWEKNAAVGRRMDSATVDLWWQRHAALAVDFTIPSVSKRRIRGYREVPGERNWTSSHSLTTWAR